MSLWPELRFPPINLWNVWPTQAMYKLHAERQDRRLWSNQMSKTYQERAYEFAAYGDQLEYPFLALGEEAGEVLGKIAKFVRKHNVPSGVAVIHAAEPQGEKALTLREDLLKELGDVQWQLAACCTELGVTLEEVQELNISKLSGRKERGTIVGEGDER